jgi:dihydroorotate dehydrogenase (fumarate)
MIDLSTRYLGLTLRSPLGCSSSPLCESLDNLRRMEDSGAGIVVLTSLFEEQLERDAASHSHWLTHGGESHPEALSYFPELPAATFGPDEYLEHLSRASQALEIPVVGSLNGTTPGGWLQYARLMQEAGAAAIELNLYTIPTDPNETSALLEARYCEVVRQVAAQVTVPVAVKLSPFLTAPLAFARRLDDAGARGLVLFNRFYQPDFDLDRLEVTPHLELSHSSELRLRLHWAAILYGHLKADLAITGGVQTPSDVLKGMMAGARVAMTTSLLLRQGIEAIANLLEGVRDWLEQHEYEAIRTMQGSMSLAAVPRPDVFERVQYVHTLRSHAIR